MDNQIVPALRTNRTKTKQCEYVITKGKRKGIRCENRGRIGAEQNGVMCTFCGEHNPIKMAVRSKLTLARYYRDNPDSDFNLVN